MNVTANRGGGGGVPSNRNLKTDTENFLRQSIQIIDGVFGEGYAKKNPALLASLLNARCREEWEIYE
jgi:hypothetical protein